MIIVSKTQTNDVWLLLAKHKQTMYDVSKTHDVFISKTQTNDVWLLLAKHKQTMYDYC